MNRGQNNILDPALNTCYFCCEWKGEASLYVCETCIEQKRMSNYHFILCKRCMGQHMLNHQNPKAQLYSKENMQRHILQNGCSFEH